MHLYRVTRAVMSTTDILGYHKSMLDCRSFVGEKVPRRNASHLKLKLDEVTMKMGVVIDEATTSDLIKIMKAHKDKVFSLHPEGSFPHLFWDQQHQAALKLPKAMWWHPLMIR